MRWFGDWPSPSPAVRDSEQGPFPVGTYCEECGKVFQADDFGYLIPGLDDGQETPYHYSCFMERILGGDWEVAFSEEVE